MMVILFGRKLMKCRAWDGEKMHPLFSINSETGEIVYNGEVKDWELLQFSGLQDSLGNDIYEGDKVYLAGYGVYDVEFPFTELYEAKTENDLGEVVGCVYKK